MRAVAAMPMGFEPCEAHYTCLPLYLQCTAVMPRHDARVRARGGGEAPPGDQARVNRNARARRASRGPVAHVRARTKTGHGDSKRGGVLGPRRYTSWVKV